jgi:hypothetical protein
MIRHLRLKMAIRMMTAQKYEYNMNGYNTTWDPMTSIADFTLLDCFQVSLGNHGIATSKEEKTMAAGVQMWQSEMFTEDQMVIWEKRGAMAQTWAALQTYFTEKWLEQKQYLATKAKQLRFKEAVLLAQETVAANEEGKIQATLFIMLQDQHAKQTAQMETTNKTSMEAMMEQMNSCGGRWSLTGQAAGQGEHPSWKKCHPPGCSNRAKKPRQKKALCPNCKCFVMYKPASCF